MEDTFLNDDESLKLYKQAKDLFVDSDYNKALEILEDMILVHKEDKNSWFLHIEQGNIFLDIADITENPDLDFAYMLGSVGCFSEDVKLSRPWAQGLFYLAEQLGSVMYYKKCVKIAKQGLSVTLPEVPYYFAAQRIMRDLKTDSKKYLEGLIKDADYNIALSENCCIKENCEPKVLESKKSPELLKNKFNGLRLYWLGLDVNIKRDFMKVSIAELISFVEGVHNRKGREALEQVLASAKEDKKWKFWICRTKCSKKFSTAEKFKKHLEEEHAADFKPCPEKVMVVMRIGKDWARKISVGGWEPVDTLAAVEMIKNRLPVVRAFAYNNGWSNEWPLAADEERSKLLKKIKFCLVMFCDLKILPCTIRDFVMQYPAKHLGKLEVSEQNFVASRLVETPQSICFLECDELNQILNFLKGIKCARDDGTKLVCRAVDNILGSTRVKEKIDFDSQSSFLLLDRRLLKSNNVPFDDDGTINVFDPNVHYAKAHPQGDDIISWLTDYNSVDKIFPRPIREHNLDIWVAVLRAVQFTCRTLRSKYENKMKFFDYYAALTVIEDLCMSEDERRRNLQEDQWNIYASLLCDRCEENIPGNFLTTKQFVCAVRDVLEGAWKPRVHFPDFADCLNLIRERKNISDDIVLKSIFVLKSVVSSKVMLIDSKILLVDNSRISLLNDLTRLSVFDNRTYILQTLKPFLLNEIVNMESKAKSDAADAAEADLLHEEEKKSQSKKKKNKSKKRFSTSISIPIDKTVEHKPSVEEDSMEAEDIFNQEEDMQKLQHMESALGTASATRFNSALEMTLKKETLNMESKAKSDAEDAEEADILLEEEKKRNSTSVSSPFDNTDEHKPSVTLEPEKTSLSLKAVEDDSKEPEDTLARLEISSNTVTQEEGPKVDPGDMQNMPGEDSLSEHLETALGAASATRYSSALNMTLKALLNIKILKEDLRHNIRPFEDQLQEQVPSALQNFFTAFVSDVIKTEGVYSCLLSDLLASLEQVLPMSSDAAEVLVVILEFWHCWKNPERESLVTRLFTLEENETMSCRICRRKPNYPEQSSYGIVMAADSIRALKCALGNIEFVDILKVDRMKYKMLCDIRTGGCGKTNFVHHIISRCPPIFTIVLEWEKNETEKEISETTKALHWKIDISRLYKGLEANTNYRLVSMVCCDQEEEHICIAYENNRWVNLRHDALVGEDVGKWKSVVRFCGDRKVRPEILFYEVVRSMS